MQALFSNLLTASFHGSIVILAVMLLRVLLKKAPRKFICFLWLLAGLRLLMPFELQSSLSLQPMPEVAQVQQWQAPEAAPAAEPTPRETFPEAPAQRQEAALPQSTVAAPTETLPAPVSPAPAAKPTFNWRAALPYVWLGVAACFALYTLYAYLSLKYKVREAVKIRGGWECDRIETAFILGFIRPKIYIPMGLSPTVRKHILAHERTHLEKGDHWFKMVGFLALALHWFNPLVWIAYVLLCKDIELACDERVVQFMELEERKSYSAALLSCSTRRAHYAACPVAFGEVSVKHRIKTILNYRRPSFWVSLLAVIAIVFVAVCLLTNPAREPESPTAETAQEQESLQKCQEALDELLSQQEYALSLTGMNEYLQWRLDLCHLGEDTLWQHTPSSSPDPTSGRMEYGGKHYAYQNGAWVETDSADTQYEEYLDIVRWDPQNATLLSDTTEENYRTISFTTTWSADSGAVETATHTYSFHPEGALYCVEIQNAPKANTTGVFLEPRSWHTDPTPAGCFREAAAAITEGAVSEEELNQQAEFDAWGFNFGVDDDRLSDSGSDVYYSQSETGRGVLTTTDEYWLERKVGSTWEPVTPVNEPQWSDNGQGVAKGTSTYGYIDWTPIYGKLPSGTYRMGKTVTCRDSSVNYTRSHDFYSEFEIYSMVDSNSPEAAAAVERCYAGLEALKNRKSLHWKSVMGKDSDFESWLDGENLLRVTNWYLPDVDPATISEHELTILPRTDTWVSYNGVGYGDVREDPELLVSPVLGLGVQNLSTSMKWNSFADDFNISFFERSNHQISFPEGIGVVSDEMVRFVTSWKVVGLEYDTASTQLTYRFDANGDLTYMEYKDDLDGREYIAYIEIYPDTAEEIDAKIRSRIENVYVSNFDWKEAKAKYATDAFNHRDSGFVNNDMVSITTPEDAARRALLEYPKLKEYLSLDVAHDDNAGMWRVTVKSYHDYQATYEYRDIYLDDNGVTMLLVYEGPLGYDESRK